jgi:hypothetical protein
MTNALSDSDIDGILDSVGREFVPEGLDRGELKQDIEAAWDFYQGYSRESSKSRRTALRRYAEKIVKAANTLTDILQDTEPVSESLRKSISRDVPLHDFLIQLRRLSHRAGLLVMRHSGWSSIRQTIEITPMEYFLGHDLPTIYEKHFKNPANRSRTVLGELEGPFMRFAMAISTTLGQSAAAETVSRAMTKATSTLDHF